MLKLKHDHEVPAGGGRGRIAVADRNTRSRRRDVAGRRLPPRRPRPTPARSRSWDRRAPGRHPSTRPPPVRCLAGLLGPPAGACAARLLLLGPWAVALAGERAQPRPEAQEADAARGAGPPRASTGSGAGTQQPAKRGAGSGGVRTGQHRGVGGGSRGRRGRGSGGVRTRRRRGVGAGRAGGSGSGVCGGSRGRRGRGSGGGGATARRAGRGEMRE
ncbi:spidroin-1-like [Panicum virgatum]|uniref:spidroin-1-like n=1 Tax=Panicum virgatum TaxID=38727 RepID=UPI0019D5EB6E|nr:spidroin-1-like [Panicum virgatum]